MRIEVIWVVHGLSPAARRSHSRRLHKRNHKSTALVRASLALGNSLFAKFFVRVELGRRCSGLRGDFVIGWCQSGYCAPRTTFAPFDNPEVIMW